MKYIFLDTNIFLHFQYFDQIDWSKIVNSNDYKIVISDIVLKELDEKKYDSNKKKAERSKNVIAKIDKIADENNGVIQNKAKSELILLNAINKAVLEENLLNIDDQDNYLIASILDFKKNNPDYDIVLISYDSGPRRKAKNLGINALKMPEDYLLPQEPDEKDKKLKELQAENLKLKNKIPKLSVFFDDNSQKKVFSISKQNLSEDENKALKIIELDKSYKPLIYKSPQELKEELDKKNPLLARFSLSSTISSFGSISSSITKEQTENYNKNLENFKSRYKEYLDEYYDYLKMKSLSIEINLCLFNDGNVPAEDISIHFHFPDGFDLHELTYREEPREPAPPEKPKTPLEKVARNMQHINSYYPSIRNNYSSPSLPSPPPNISSPYIRRTNSYDVNLHVQNLKHTHQFCFNTLVVTFPSFEEIINFTIDYDIVASNVPEKVKGILNVIVSKDNN